MRKTRVPAKIELDALERDLAVSQVVVDQVELGQGLAVGDGSLSVRDGQHVVPARSVDR